MLGFGLHKAEKAFVDVACSGSLTISTEGRLPVQVFLFIRLSATGVDCHLNKEEVLGVVACACVLALEN